MGRELAPELLSAERYSAGTISARASSDIRTLSKKGQLVNAAASAAWKQSQASAPWKAGFVAPLPTVVIRNVLSWREMRRILLAGPCLKQHGWGTNYPSPWSKTSADISGWL